jgi:hypothetical protein
MDSLNTYLALDLLILGVVVMLMMPRISLWHPLTAYLLFHFYSFTWRLIAIIDGSPLLYTGQANAEPVTIDEIKRGMIWADVAIVMFGIASSMAHRVFEANSNKPVSRRMMNPDAVRAVGFICIPLGFTVFFGIRNDIIGIDYGSASSGYLLTAATWPMGALAVMIFTFGFRMELVVLSAIYLSAVVFQGRNRFMFVLPLFFLVAYHVQSLRRRWPSLAIFVACLVMAVIFPRLKPIGLAVQDGNVSEVRLQLEQAFNLGNEKERTMQGENFLDQYAGALTLVDYSGQKMMGKTYLAVLTLPIPRAWWPEKPGLADHIKEISTIGRQYSVDGRIITYLGEAYLNFGYAGFFFVPACAGYLLTLVCLRATSGPMLRLGRYLYLVLFTSLVQAFRDGLASLVLFTFVHNMPMLFTWMLHLMPNYSRKALDRPPADPLAGEEEVDIARRDTRGR